MERLLIIEDDQALYKPIKHVFEYEGFTLQFAADGAMGLAAFRAIPPSLVVLDLKLPKIHGRDLCRTMKQEDPDIPIVVQSSSPLSSASPSWPLPKGSREAVSRSTRRCRP